MGIMILWGQHLENESIVTDLNQIKILAKQHHDDFEVLGYTLELLDEVSDSQIDNWVDRIAQPIINAIDCTQCANCCRSLDVYLTQGDAQQLKSNIDISLDSIIDYQSARKVGEWGTFKAKPCGFLQDNLCSVYAHRPETCRTYPTFTPDFRWTFADTIEGASICPIIYNVLIQLHQRSDELFDL